MHRQRLLQITLIVLIIVSFDAKSQDILKGDKYNVFTDAINQIQRDDAIRLLKSGYKKDTINYYPILIKKKTAFKTDSIGFFLNERLKSNRSIFDGAYLNIDKFTIIENNKLVCLDTTFIKLHYTLDSLCKSGKKLSNNFLFKSKVIFTCKPKYNSFGIFRIDIEKFWKRFYKKYPNSFGIFEVSDVFFSKDENQAILYIGYHRQGLVGYGAIYLLKKEDRVWRIVKDRGIWVE